MNISNLTHLIIIFIIMICLELGLSRPVSASPNCIFRGLPIYLHPFGIQFNITFAILLLFILVTCRSQFDLDILSFSSSGSTLRSSKISSFLLWLKKVYSRLLYFEKKKFISVDVNIFFIFLMVQISLPYKKYLGEPVHCILLSLEIPGPKLV
jgi:hypothetical protein